MIDPNSRLLRWLIEQRSSAATNRSKSKLRRLDSVGGSRNPTTAEKTKRTAAVKPSGDHPAPDTVRKTSPNYVHAPAGSTPATYGKGVRLTDAHAPRQDGQSTPTHPQNKTSAPPIRTADGSISLGTRKSTHPLSAKLIGQRTGFDRGKPYTHCAYSTPVKDFFLEIPYYEDCEKYLPLPPGWPR